MLELPPGLLILDLDQTLIFSSEHELEHLADFRVGSYFTYKRPISKHSSRGALSSLKLRFGRRQPKITQLKLCTRFLELEHSNSSGLENAVRFVDFEEIGERIYTKPLAKIRKLGFNLERVIAVNDVAENYHDAYGNLVQVRKYLGDSSDTELLRLGQYLPRLASESNIRKLEQRH